ncbi:hypothetical protein C8Q80DRAFT_1199395 [Daedaleopsis nitida]|nr:hypothetical protein C8Q80DRAFT_1199395 [Daedaleopsis nitida]
MGLSIVLRRHPVLECTDTLEAILEELDPGRDKQGRAACASVARVCRNTNHVASRVLWRKLDGLCPLWTLLMPWTHKSYNDHMRAIIDRAPFKEPVVWARFLAYAERVKHITIWHVQDNEGLLIETLFALNKNSAILSSLKTLSWIQHIHSSANPLLMAPRTLKSLSIYPPSSPDPHERLKTIVDGLTSTFPSLRALCLNGFPGRAATLLKEIAGLRHGIRHLTLSPRGTCRCALIPSDWDLLSTSFSMSGLVVNVSGFKEDSPATIQLTTLRRLECAGSWKQISLLLASLRAPSLQSLVLAPHEHDKPVASASLADCFQTISSSFPRLRKLVLKRRNGPYRTLMHVGAPVGDVRRASFSDIFRPCLALRELEEISVRMLCLGGSISFTDDDILSMAKAFPRLRHLEVTIQHVLSFQHLYSLTALSLVHVARHCPRLVSFEVFSLDMRSLPDSEHAGLSGSESHPLRTLAFTQFRRPIDPVLEEYIEEEDEGGDVTGFLNTLFPNLRDTNKFTTADAWHMYEGWEPAEDPGMSPLVM